MRPFSFFLSFFAFFLSLSFSLSLSLWPQPQPQMAAVGEVVRAGDREEQADVKRSLENVAEEIAAAEPAAANGEGEGERGEGAGDGWPGGRHEGEVPEEVLRREHLAAVHERRRRH